MRAPIDDFEPHRSSSHFGQTGQNGPADLSEGPTAQIFWLKTRAKWQETPFELRHSGSVVRRDLTEFSDAELIAMLGTAVDLHETKAIHEKPSKTDVRGFLELVAGDEYRPKQ